MPVVSLPKVLTRLPDIGKLIKESTLENILEHEKQLASEFKNMGHFKFTIIEEKRKSYKLEDYELQVVGEALAMCVTLLRADNL